MRSCSFCLGVIKANKRRGKPEEWKLRSRRCHLRVSPNSSKR